MTYHYSARAEQLHAKLTAGALELGEDLACASAPDMFFPDPEVPGSMANVKHAKAMCLSCPLISVCAEYGIEANEEFGIFGGLTPHERRLLQRQAQTDDRAHA